MSVITTTAVIEEQDKAGHLNIQASLLTKIFLF